MPTEIRTLWDAYRTANRRRCAITVTLTTTGARLRVRRGRTREGWIVVEGADKRTMEIVPTVAKTIAVTR